MNATQIKYIHQCISKRRDRLRSEVYNLIPAEPAEVTEARELIQKWEEESRRERSKLIAEIDNKCRELEAALILSPGSPSGTATLAELDAWGETFKNTHIQ